MSGEMKDALLRCPFCGKQMLVYADLGSAFHPGGDCLLATIERGEPLELDRADYPSWNRRSLLSTDNAVGEITAAQLLAAFQQQTGENENEVYPPMPDDKSVIIEGEFDLEEIVRALTASLVPMAADKAVGELREALEKATTQLDNLHAMVCGECPSLLEDHPSAPLIVEAIEAGEAALNKAGG